MMPTMDGAMDPSSGGGGGRSQPHMTARMRWEWLKRLVLSGWIRDMSAVRSFREACEGLLYECYSDSVHNPHNPSLQSKNTTTTTMNTHSSDTLDSTSIPSSTTFVNWPHAHSLRIGAVLRPAMTASARHNNQTSPSTGNKGNTSLHGGLTMPNQIVRVVRMLLRSRSARRRPYNSTTNPLPYFKEATAALEARGIDVYGTDSSSSTTTTTPPAGGGGSGRTPSPPTSPHRRAQQQPTLSINPTPPGTNNNNNANGPGQVAGGDGQFSLAFGGWRD